MDRKKKFIVLFLVLAVVLTLALFLYLAKTEESEGPVLSNPQWKQSTENDNFKKAIAVVEETVRGLGLSRQSCKEEIGQFWCINYYEVGSSCFKNRIGVGERNYKEWHNYWILQKEATNVDFSGIKGYSGISSSVLDLTSIYLDNYSFTASINPVSSFDCINLSQKTSNFSSKEVMDLLAKNINKYYK